MCVATLAPGTDRVLRSELKRRSGSPFTDGPGDSTKTSLRRMSSLPVPPVGVGRRKAKGTRGRKPWKWFGPPYKEYNRILQFVFVTDRRWSVYATRSGKTIVTARGASILDDGSRKMSTPPPPCPPRPLAESVVHPVYPRLGPSGRRLGGVVWFWGLTDPESRTIKNKMRFPLVDLQYRLVENNIPQDSPEDRGSRSRRLGYIRDKVSLPPNVVTGPWAFWVRSLFECKYGDLTTLVPSEVKSFATSVVTNVGRPEGFLQESVVS